MKPKIALLITVLASIVFSVGCTTEKTTVIEDTTPDVKRETTIINPPDVKIETNPPK